VTITNTQRILLADWFSLILYAGASPPPNPRHFVVTHLLNVADEWLYGDEKRPELRALTKPLEMAFVRVPFDAQNKM
jgi:hypothetical protein